MIYDCSNLISMKFSHDFTILLFFIIISAYIIHVNSNHFLFYRLQVCLISISVFPPSGLFKHSQDLSRGVLAQHIPGEQRATAFGRFNSASSIGFILGPVIGGHLAEWLDDDSGEVGTRTAGFTVCSLLCAAVFSCDLGWLLTSPHLCMYAL